MIIKRGVSLFGMRPELLCLLPMIDQIYRDIVGEECRITSGIDGEHNTIVHSIGCAVDIGIRDIDKHILYTNGEIIALEETIREKLNHEYDVVLEEDHIQIELDRR